MRMDQSQQLTAREIVNRMPPPELITLFQRLGEVARPQKVVKAMIEQRKRRPFTTTKELASLIERVDGWRRKGHHPATKYFLALRLRVNEELDQLEMVLPKMIRDLRPGGRLQVISFHSLEDRIVKHTFKASGDCGKPVFKKVIMATREEQKANPRSRSAKLRVFQREGAQ